MDQYTFYKNEDGVLYGVNARVIKNGFTPQEGHVLATEEERLTFIRKALGDLATPEPEPVEPEPKAAKARVPRPKPDPKPKKTVIPLTVPEPPPLVTPESVIQDKLAAAMEAREKLLQEIQDRHGASNPDSN